jgi:uncharacterized membrane protein
MPDRFTIAIVPAVIVLFALACGTSCIPRPCLSAVTE